MSNVTTNRGHGTTHHVTEGRTFRLQGFGYTNSSTHGKADCGSITSAAAIATDGPVTCPKCAALNA